MTPIRTIKLPYGQTHIDLRIPRNKNIKVLLAKRTKRVADPKKYSQAKIQRYFKENKPFFLRFKGKRVCVVVSDNTRLAFNHIIVPIVLKELVDIGILKENITILIANGLHAPMSKDDFIENMGKDVERNFKIENHDPNGELVTLGTTTRGTLLTINKRFIDAELKIATGLATPHFHAGFGGGCKSILPGISGRLSILKNHSFDMVAHENARFGISSGNPIYEDIMEAGLKSGLDIIVNATLDSGMNLSHLFIGKPKEAFAQAVKKVVSDMKVEFSDPFDIVVSTNGGFPLDRNLYQCVKGVAVGELMIRQGGTIIIAAECRDGVGHETFQNYMSYGETPRDVLEKLKKDEPVMDQDNIQILARALTKAKIIIITQRVEPDVIKKMKMEHAKSVEDALRACGWPERIDLKIGIVPAGPYVLPVES